ncbi:MAG: UpxY family transcription antiterminator [Bacteroidetes bacterium]|nr:UpxY family transcription antiterminator [Bacteroidota bacterium]MBU1580301.1 UpxY family transcription antiterminator [Bacteroidota bacterium]MBU2557413.1 UpxY family transcription antiterminator [Bacteroidota bacterium]
MIQEVSNGKKDPNPPKFWYAIYVRSKTEKKVQLEFDFLGIESYLPLVTRLKQWSDRKKKIEEPLFRSYIFVHIQESQFFTVRNVPGVMKYISFEGKPAVIPDEQIKAIHYYLNEQDDHEEMDADKLIEGQLVRIKHGQMAGLIGRMIHYKNRYRLLIQIEAIGQIISLNIPRSKVEAIRQE